MFRPMGSIFSSKGFLTAIFAMLLLLGGCGKREPHAIQAPKQAVVVIEAFLKEVSAGNKDKAAAFASPAAIDELDTQFVEDHKKLAASEKLTLRYTFQSGGKAYRRDDERLGDGEEVTMVYAAKTGDKWTSATVRAYKYRDEQFKVEYWRVANEAPRKPVSSNVDAKRLKRSEAFRNASLIGIALMCLFGIVLLIWLVVRKPHLRVRGTETEARRPASTVRDKDF